MMMLMMLTGGHVDSARRDDIAVVSVT